MRQFIRHPSDIPIQYDIGDTAGRKEETLKDISHGGLSFTTGRCIEPGTGMTVHITIRKPPFNSRGVAAWCAKNDDGTFEVGVEFEEKKTDFTLRMVEQVCHIEHYKKEVKEREGRELSGREAAAEWIRKYAGDFPV
ncbi:MAG: PilZ domain-containing protein [Candidatus Latescibacteria bacterium]|nr:PilZ domain-containing protein [Candidatus Latescibacterota bacterium]